ncbi:cyclic nucleotide-binding-like protein [Blyttiomyces helicus]|uniref:Cyclic nucleotide-binding-like protein n=1 Tax=Blyttiomyces helicus TaxID=388810 RepID=A0A4P9W7M5_9FUNG|nr:cyclic nucleotide-binding-like protein [Blyttiomyces helicus]|eukprot:RKO88092.1 cyclic nucleotide-binding-like protein [Blyttiomyces helicus]
MYFILDGSVAIVVNGNVVASLHYGNFFGEVALIAQIPRTATVRAATPCHLYRLSRVDFMLILEEFEDMARRVDLIYEERMAKVRAEQEAKQRAEEERKQLELRQNGQDEGNYVEDKDEDYEEEEADMADLAEQGAVMPKND